MIIHGGARLSGAVSVSGSKNAALPILMASLLTEEPVRIRNLPHLRDVNTALELLRGLGVVEPHGPATISWCCTPRTSLRTRRPTNWSRPCALRSSCSARCSRAPNARKFRPPADARSVRARSICTSRGIRALGARVQLRNGYVEAHADRLRGARIWLDNPSVGATENIMMAAVLADGKTTIENAAREPEVQDLAKFLVAMGANMRGAGTHVIEIEGVERLHGAEHEVIPDRIEAGSLMIAAAITGGDVSIRDVPVDQLEAVIVKLRETGVSVIAADGGVRVSGNGALRPVELRTLPYPGFPTDLQAQMMALLASANGTSVITETIFENRFMHALN